jgi:hypothetical protein
MQLALLRRGVEQNRAQRRAAVLQRALAQGGLHFSDNRLRFQSARADLVGQRTAEHEGRCEGGKVVDAGHQIDHVDADVITPEPIKDWSLTSLKEKLIKIGAKVVSHGRYVAFQMAEVAIPRNLFADILRLIAETRAPPHISTA